MSKTANLIRRSGLILFILSILTLSATLFLGQFRLTNEILNRTLSPDHLQSLEPGLESMLDRNYESRIEFIADFKSVLNTVNEKFRAEQKWDNVIYTDYTFLLVKAASHGVIIEYSGLIFFAGIGLMIIAALLYILPAVQENPGIKNNSIWDKSATSRGWIGIITGTWLILFYILLYEFPEYISNWVILVDPISIWLNGSPASQWFLYGLMYTLAILVMGVRMLIKYRHSKYQQIRTLANIFFQTCFAFILVQILQSLNLPAVDLKNIWPLDYSFFFDYRLDELMRSGMIGFFMLGWGIALFLIAVPLMTYFFGKRWYCSWVCGCGGLAETLGDPYRQLSDKSLLTWKIERWMIHLVLVFAVLMTGAVLYSYLSGDYEILGLSTYDIRSAYGFWIGSIFSGIIGVGFYPFMGSRVWCRFGCPLAAYLGLIQRFKSRFRITTNGGQCISCGNCSTYCEMGIDVRWYAERGEDIVRSSCVGCGICSAVCPRGVLKLENGTVSLDEQLF
ncbi:MAG: 4Fe-4S binding protein [Calditrichaeota bacterium]|nr:4Fe-4S binding protein [Calditrichota bacterium]